MAVEARTITIRPLVDPPPTADAIFVNLGYERWMKQGACVGADPGLFYPQFKGQRPLPEALAYCARCPVQQQCREFAAANDEMYGIWGGISWLDRRKADTKPAGYRSPHRAVGRHLANRRAKVMELTRAGLTAKEIAAIIGVTDRTVERDRATFTESEKL